MVTTLVTQLQQLRASAVNAPFQNQFKKVASLLYDIPEASEKSIDTIHDIGRKAFDELCEVDARLRQFETILFSEGSKNVDRFLQTQADNDALNGVLSSFIHLLGPHFLLGATIRALEWLVRRFRIHNCNAEVLLLTFLPYYSHPSFSRLLVIVTLPKPIWNFLEARKKDKTALCRHEIVMALSRNPEFYHLVAQFVQDMASEGKCFQALATFWASVAVEAITRMRQAGIDEDVIMQRTLQFAAEGVQFHAFSDYQISSYMILTILASKSTLTDQVLVTIMNEISMTWSKESFKSALLCIAQLMQVREGNNPLPDVLYKAMNDVKETETVLQEIVSKYRADKLLTGFLISLIKGSTLTLDSIKRVERYFKSGRLSQTQTKVVLSELFNSILKKNTPGSRVQLSDTLNKFKDDTVLSPILNSVLAEDINRAETLEMTLQVNLRTNDVQSEVSIETCSQTSDSESIEELLQDSQLIEDIPDSYFGDITPKFEKLMAIFDRASVSRDDLRIIMESSVFPKDELALITFFGYIWSVSTHVTKSRIMALNLAKNALFSTEQTDFQMLIPYLLTAFADHSLDIRKAAVSVFREIVKLYGKMQMSPVGRDVVYGENSKNVNWLSWSSAKYFANEVVASHLEEYVLDEEKIIKVIGQELSGIGKKGIGKVKAEILSFLASTAIVTPIFTVRISLINQLNAAETVQKTELLLPLLKSTVASSSTYSREGINVFSAKRTLVAVISHKESEGLAVLKELLSNQDPEFATLACERTCELWSSMRKDSQLAFASALLKIVVAGSSPIVQKALETLHNIPISTQVFENILKDIAVVSKTISKNVPKKARIHKSCGTKSKTTAEAILHELTVALELLDKHNPEEKSPLIGLLFGKLTDVLLIEEDTRISASYAKQMLLVCMNSMIEGCKDSRSKFETRDIRVDVLVSCIQSSTSAQVHNRALLLVANLAELCPELVLHSVMPIFTFVGANVLQQDDNYSVHVIQQAIQSIIPALVKTSKDVEQAVLDSVGVLNSFVNAYTHIPKHRRLFSALTETLGPSDFLYAILSLLAEQSLSYSRSTDKSSLREFVPSLAKSFPLEVQITTIRKMTVLVKQFLETSAIGEKSCVLNMFFPQHQTLEELEPIICEIINFINIILRSKSFHISVKTRGSSDVDSNYSGLIRDLLMVVTECRNKKVSDGLFTSLDSTLKLLPWSSFAATFQDIMKSCNEKFRRASIAIVQSRIELEPLKSETLRKQALSVLDSLIENISTQFEDLTIQAALNCITIMAKKYSSNEPLSFVSLVPTLCGSSALRHESVDVRISSMVCITVLCETLGPRMVPFLPKLVPFVLNQSHWHIEDSVDIVDLSIFSLLTSLITSVPTFMGSYMQMIILFIQRSNASYDTGSDCHVAYTELVQTISAHINPTTSVSAVIKSWGKVKNGPCRQIIRLVEVVGQIIKSASRTSITSLSPDIFDLFLELFDICQRFDDRDTYTAETLLIDILVQMIMKLNDKTFRPLFTKFAQWTLPADESSDTLEKRFIVFYRFMDLLCGSFKGIVTNYYSLILDDTVLHLETFSSKRAWPEELWGSILSSLKWSFEYDNESRTPLISNLTTGFWKSPERFNKICPAVMAQLSLSPKVIPTIVKMAVAGGSSDHYQKINSEVLKLFRSEDPLVRIAAIDAEEALYDELGEEWLCMLPQTVPFIAEAMEDDNDQTVRAVQKLIAKIESYLGESLQKFLQ